MVRRHLTNDFLDQSDQLVNVWPLCWLDPQTSPDDLFHRLRDHFVPFLMLLLLVHNSLFASLDLLWSFVWESPVAA